MSNAKEPDRNWLIKAYAAAIILAVVGIALFAGGLAEPFFAWTKISLVNIYTMVFGAGLVVIALFVVESLRLFHDNLLLPGELKSWMARYVTRKRRHASKRLKVWVMRRLKKRRQQGQEKKQ